MFIQSALTVLKDYDEGESVSLLITVFNEGPTGIADGSIWDLDTGNVIADFGDVVQSGETKEFNPTIGVMPSEDWELRIGLTVAGVEVDSTGVTVLFRPLERVEEVPTAEELAAREAALAEQVVEVVSVPKLPWYAAWLAPVIDWVSSMAEWLAQVGSPLFAPLKPIGDFFSNPIKFVKDSIATFFTEGAEKSIEAALDLTEELAAGSPEWHARLNKSLGPMKQNLIDSYNKALDVAQFGTGPVTPETAVEGLNKMRDQIMAAAGANFALHAATEAGSLGQFEFMRELDSMIISKLGVDQILSRSILLPIEKSVLIPAEYMYNRIYTPLIPDVSEMINEVVKEVIPLTEFQAQMRNLGFNREWSQRIWDAHFIAPALSHLLRSWRRGTITTDRLNELQIIVDLDPRFSAIWEDQRFNDPTLREARYMFEQRAIEKDQVKRIVELSGLLPEYVDPMTQYLTTFQERPWLRGYLLAVAMGYRENVYSAEELRSEVISAGYSDVVADWIIKTEDVRRKIGEVEPVGVKSKILPYSYVLDAFEFDIRSEDWIREELSERNMSLEDIEVMMSVINRRKSDVLAKEETRRLKALEEKPTLLTLSYAKDLYVHGDVNEVWLRSYFESRGHTSEDIDLAVKVLDRQKEKYEAKIGGETAG